MTDTNTAAATDTEKLDEALACVRKYGRQSAVDTRAIETALRDLRTRLATRTRELEPAEA
jgi:tRNA G26 N,N-dimethylase Trm1